jgi:hypothetical protein
MENLTTDKWVITALFGFGSELHMRQNSAGERATCDLGLLL